MKCLAVVALLMVLPVSPLSAAEAFEIVEGTNGFHISTTRLEVEVRDGVIVSAKNLLTGEIHAAAKVDEQGGVPAGMGVLDESSKVAAAHHSPWGNRPLGDPASRRTAFPTHHRPHAGSQYRAARTASGIEATWTGLSNGKETFPDEALTLAFEVDQDTGALQFRARVSSPTGGVYGAQAPIANLHEKHRIYVPTFGGLIYDQRMKPSVVTLGAPPFWEAPVMAIEGQKGSLGLWIEDESMQSTFAVLSWTGRSFAVAIESLALMPFEPHTEFETATWKIDAFDGGWVAAMTPYKDWYARTFAKETSQRSAVAWADDIRVILDEVERDPEVWDEIASILEPQTVLVHEWNARAASFDQDLPDWTPREGYVERVKALQARGFRTMAYVNTYCVNYNSPVFKRDKIAEFGLTRRIPSFFKYNQPQTFENTRDGQLLYLDPLSPEWRAYHTDMMIRWREDTGTDANYEDVGGTTGDFGNGIIDGKRGAQGGVEQFRELLARNGGVPMAAEFCPDAIAFAVRWPLRYQQVWGSKATREPWMELQRPVSAYIHGPDHRAWVPTLRAEDAFHRHLVADCSDALGGLAQFRATRAELQATAGIAAQMKYRAQLFSKRRLVPEFAPELEEPSLACRYRDREGRRYEYRADENVHQLVGEDGKALYARITGMNRFETTLRLPGWPARNDKMIFGLDPAARYALMPSTQPAPSVRVHALPEGIKITRYYETPSATVLCMSPVDDASPSEGVCRFTVDSTFRQVLVNDKPQLLSRSTDRARTKASPLQLKLTFPAQLVFVRGQPAPAAIGEYVGDGQEHGRYIMVETGLDRGGEFIIEHRAHFSAEGEEKPVPIFFLNWGGDSEVVVDWLVQVPGEKATLKVYLQNRQNVYGDGTIARLYVNGRLVREQDFGPKENPDWTPGMPAKEKTIWDKDVRTWTAPLGHLAGQTVLITVATDPKQGNNADSLWWSRPKLVAGVENR